MTPIEQYRHDLARADFHADAVQERAVTRLQELHDRLLNKRGRTKYLLGRVLRQHPPPVRGLYLWGGTGRGKTYLVDRFYECLPFPEKHRIHFHHFMVEVHRQMRVLPDTVDPLYVIARRLSDSIKVLCLDEFHVHDIADAMIMARLLEALFHHSVTLVATSNIAIQDLYQNGLQRERFLPAIGLLLKHTEEVELGHGRDFRLEILERQNVFFVNPLAQHNALLEQRFDELAPSQAKHRRTIDINGRRIDYIALADDVIWFDYNALCNTPRAASDYIEIAQRYSTVFLGDITVMQEQHDAQAKRFIHLIDALYDHKVKLIAASEVPPVELYQGVRLKFAFERTISRLTEMGDRRYLQSPHIAGSTSIGIIQPPSPG